MNRHGCQDGDAIRRLREERAYFSERAQRGHWSIKEVAGRIGITPQSLSNIELGNKPAGLAVLIRISREFGVPVDKILKAEGETEAETEDVAAALWPAPWPATRSSPAAPAPWSSTRSTSS